MLNQIVLVGRLVSKPNLEKEESGKSVSHITLAVPRSYKNENGEYETDFLPIILWNGVAQNTVEYCCKGDLIGIKGRVQETKGKICIVAEKVTFLSNTTKEE